MQLLIILLTTLVTNVHTQISFGFPPKESSTTTEATTTAAASKKSCTSPHGLAGECVNLLECRSILQLLRRKPIPPDVLTFLRQSVCGFKGKLPDICCPTSRAIRPVKPETER